MTDVFVFGSNEAGYHGAGAAKHALATHGARYGIGEGLVGSSYALPTKDRKVRTLPLVDVACRVRTFLGVAARRPELTFMVTAIGCGLAGFTPAEIAPFFDRAIDMPNVRLPIEFCRELGITDPDKVSFQATL